MKYLIVANGIIVDSNILLGAIQEADIVVCADGGAKHLKRVNVAPDVVIGDMDSIGDDTKFYMNSCVTQNLTTLVRYPERKDASDTELAVFWAIAHGATYITLIGVTGNRMDHTMSNIFLLRTISQRGVECKIVDDHNEIYMLSHDSSVTESAADIVDTTDQLSDPLYVKKSTVPFRSISVTGKPGELLSIIPATEEVSGLTLKGLEYPLDNATLRLGSSRGVSNVFTEYVAHISLKKGILLVTKSCD